MKIDLEIINELISNYGYKIEVVTNNNNIEKFYKKNDIKCINIGREHIRAEKNLEYYLDKYGFTNPQKDLWQRELKILGRKVKYLAKSSLDYFVFFEKYFSNSESDILFHNGDHYFHIIAEKVAKYYNKKVVYHNSLGLFPSQMVFSNSRKYTNFFNEKYLDEKIPSIDKENIEKFIEDKINKKPLIGGRRKLVGLYHIEKLFYYLKNYFLIGKYRKDYRFPFIFIKDISYRLYNIFFNKISYDSIEVVDKKSLFLPLHVPNDAQITTREYKFMNQYKLIEDLLKIIPEEYSLTIKEHPHGRGMLNMKKVEKLKDKHDNLYILEPFENAYSIIEKCKSVITINSDVGYESILYGKKPITLGNSFYSGYGYDIQFDFSKDDIGKLLDHSDFNINKEDVIKFVYSLQKVHKDCIFFKNSKLEFNLDKKNIESIAFYIDNFVGNEQ